MLLGFSPATWQIWSLALPALALLMAVEWDVRERRIPNLLVVLLAGAGVFMQALGPANGQGGVFAAYPGALGAGAALLGGLTGLALFLPLYLLRAMGAGDVKLLAALGTFTGPLECVGLALAVLLAGGLLAVARVLLRRNARVVGRNVGLVLSSWGQGGGGFDPATDSVDRMPYALAFAVGGAGYAGWRLLGGGAFLG